MVQAQIIRDWRGRAYSVGDSAEQLLGRPRSWMLWLPWLAMLAISPLQYGYGAAVPHLMAARGWTLAEALAPMAAWAVCQAAIAFPTARSLERRATGASAGQAARGAAPPAPGTTTGRPGRHADGTARADHAPQDTADTPSPPVGPRDWATGAPLSTLARPWATEGNTNRYAVRDANRDTGRGSGRETSRSGGRRPALTGPDRPTGRSLSSSPAPSLRGPLLAAALLVTAGLLTVGLAAGPGWTLLGYGVLGGTGAGIVYAICSVVLSAWYPERPAAHVGFVTGAFAYGSVPLVIAAPGHLGPAFVAAAVLAGAAVAVAAVFVRTPPARWWPPHLDPRAWSMGNRAFRANPRAPRDFSMGQAVRTGVLPALCVILVLAAGVSIFNVVSVAVLAAGMAPAAWAAVALLIAANGAGRAVAMVVSERAGRRPTLSFTLALLAAGQVLLASDTATGSPAGLTVSALVAGLGGGAFYPLIASLVRDYFGETGTTGIHAVVYSAKAVAGVLGAALVLLSATTWSHPHVSMLTGALAALSALLSTRLRQPGRPLTLPHAPPAQPHAPR